LLGRRRFFNFDFDLLYGGSERYWRLFHSDFHLEAGRVLRGILRLRRLLWGPLSGPCPPLAPGLLLGFGASSAEAQDQVERRFLENAVVREGPPFLELSSCEEEPLLVFRDAFFVKDLRHRVVCRVCGLDVDGERPSR
jgi:hypothetical protein